MRNASISQSIGMFGSSRLYSYINGTTKSTIPSSSHARTSSPCRRFSSSTGIHPCSPMVPPPSRLRTTSARPAIHSVTTGVYSSTSSGMEVRRAAPIGDGKVQFQSVGRIVEHELPRKRPKVVPHLRLGEISPAIRDFQPWIDAPVARKPQIRPEFHTLFVRAVDQHLQRIESSFHQAVHRVPRMPSDGVRERLLVRPEHQAHLRRVEQPVPPRHAVAERVH